MIRERSQKDTERNTFRIVIFGKDIIGIRSDADTVVACVGLVKTYEYQRHFHVRYRVRSGYFEPHVKFVCKAVLDWKTAYFLEDVSANHH